MKRGKRYRKYDATVKAAISMTGRPNLFPEMKIPKMTALHWIRTEFETSDPVLSGLAIALNEARRESEELKNTLLELQAIVALLHYVHKVLEHKIQWKHISSPDVRGKILDAIQITIETVPRDRCLGEIGLSLSRYKRWRRERRICGYTKAVPCPKWIANQLTLNEIQTMKRLVTSREFAHFPIESLHYYAKREGLLFCAYSTWRKYIELYGWRRERLEYPKPKKKLGIRANAPNEIWHLDLSYWPIPGLRNLYIQVVVDNYSRYAIAWQVLDSYDGSKTATLIKKALLTVAKIRKKKKMLDLLVDGGGENKSKKVTELQPLHQFRKRVARFEIEETNAVVESVFRSLKNNYLYHQKGVITVAALTRHVDFWFSEHNKKIPHTAFKGETPWERFNGTWSKKDEIRLLVNHESAVKLRIQENQKVFCEECDS